MSRVLFNVAKTGMFLDAFSPGIEKRRGEEVKVITLTLRVQPFDAKLATSIDDGLGDDTNVRANVFKLNTADPKPHIERVNFSLDVPRQRLIIFASPDTEVSRLCFDQCKITGPYVRTQKDVAGLAFVFRASFGPVGRDELEAVQHWYRSQQFVTFEEAEPGLFEDDEDSDDLGDDDRVAAPQHAPMWDDGDQAAPEAEAPRFDSPKAKEVGARKPMARGSKTRTKRHDPEAEREAQASAGKDATA